MIWPFKKEKWALVKILDQDTIFEGNPLIYKFYYRLYESKNGNRKVEFACTNPRCDLKVSASRHPIYQEKIIRWKEGRYDPDIPTYSQIPEEETAVMLRGKI
jgi:hypothetical protein